MILNKSKHLSVQMPTAWTQITPHITDIVYSTITETFKYSTPTPYSKQIQNVSFSKEFTRRHKLILEYFIAVSQLRKSPIMVFTTKEMNFILVSMGKKKSHRNRCDLLSIMDYLSTLRISFGTQGNEILDFSTMISTNGKTVSVNFSQFHKQKDKVTTSKKYLLNIKSNSALWMMDFFRVKVQQKNHSKEHPRQFRYRSFTKDSVLEWFNLKEDYYLYGNDQLGMPDRQRKIDLFINKNLRLLKDYAKKNNLEFPSYRLKDGMYQVTDYGYVLEDKVTMNDLMETIKNLQIPQNQ